MTKSATILAAHPDPDLTAAAVVDRLWQLGEISDEPDALTRTFLSPAMALANEKVGQWMRDGGLQVTVDDWGNLIGRLASENPEAKTLVLGSHLDTVRNAGRYDGPLGVLLALAVCEPSCRQEGCRLPFHLDVIGFSDEEGGRFHSAYLGSKALAGLITTEDLKLTDADGVTLAQRRGNGRLASIGPLWGRPNLLGYVEAHIEQGPVLEAEGCALGAGHRHRGAEPLLLHLHGTGGARGHHSDGPAPGCPGRGGRVHRAGRKTGARDAGSRRHGGTHPRAAQRQQRDRANRGPLASTSATRNIP